MVGVAALLMSADPSLRGQVGVVETTLQGTAVGLTTHAELRRLPGTQVPNNTYGHGRVDAFEAGRTRSADLALTSTAWPNRTKVGRRLSHSLTVGNAGPLAAAAVVADASAPGGVRRHLGHAQPGHLRRERHTITCALGSVGMGGSAVVQVEATPGTPGAANSQATVASGQPDIAPANNTAVPAHEGSAMRGGELPLKASGREARLDQYRLKRSVMVMITGTGTPFRSVGA